MDAYIHIDSLEESLNEISDARCDYLEEAAIKLLAKWKKQLDADDYIPDIDADHAEIIAQCVERQLPFDKVLFDLAWEIVDQLEKDELL